MVNASTLDQSTYTFPKPVTIHESVQVLDWRPLPNPDIPQFIAEIKNIGDQTIDAPTVGLLFEPNSEASKITWGNPWHTTLTPDQSTFVVGPLPSDHSLQQLLDDARWILCENGVSRSRVNDSPASIVEISEIRVDVRERSGRIDLLLTNHGMEPARWFHLVGMLRDIEGRVVGSNLRRGVSVLQAGESIETTLWVLPYDFSETAGNLANAYYLLDSGDHWTVELAVDARAWGVNRPCPAVMPWNR